MERLQDLGWRCPEVRIVGKNGEMGNGILGGLVEVDVIPGGAIVEGWREGDERPDLSGEEAVARWRLYI